jgi:hypothetical protein
VSLCHTVPTFPLPKHHSSQWSRGLRPRSAATPLLGLRVRIPAGSWISVSSKYRALSGRVLCDRPTSHPGESYRVWCFDCGLKTSTMSPRPPKAVKPWKKKSFHRCPIFAHHRHLKCEIALTRQHIITSEVFSFGASSLWPDISLDRVCSKDYDLLRRDSIQLGDKYIGFSGTYCLHFLPYALAYCLIPEYRTPYTHRQVNIKLHIRIYIIVTLFKI